MKTKSTQLTVAEDIHTKIKKYGAENGGLTIPESINRILKNYFKSSKSDTDELLSREEVKEVFEACLSNLK